jgi:DNA-binding transcriptional LysR family regulator
MNLNHLAIFHAVALTGGVGTGAARLHISQSAVSKQLADFENHLGAILFDRLPRGVRLTEAGRLLLGYANRIFSLESEAEQVLGDLHALRRGRVSIGASRTIGGYLLPAILAQFNRLHPDIELTLEVANTAAIQTMLIDGAIDVGYTEGLSRSEALEFSVMAEDELVLIAAPGADIALARAHAGLPAGTAAKKPVRIPANAPANAPASTPASAPVRATTHKPAGALAVSALDGLPLLMRELGSGTRAVMEQALATHGVVPRSAMTLASTEAIKRMVAAGMGYAFVSALAVSTEVEAGLLTIVPIKGLRIRRPLHQLELKGSWTSPAVTAFLQFMCQNADSYRASRAPTP